MVVLAIIFLVVLFLIKIKSRFENQVSKSGLVYGNATLAEVVRKDTDFDGVLDWEESLWGTDPTKKDTDEDGEADGAEIAQMKADSGMNEGTDSTATAEENLTETDKFSRELFTTIVTLNQAGEVDEATAEKLSAALSDQITNYAPRKIFLASEIKIIEDNSAGAVEKYILKIGDIFRKYPADSSVIDILQEFVGDGENDNVAALSELDPIVKQTSGAIDEMIKMNVPSELATLHLELVNTLERLMENLNDIQLFDIDPIVAMGAMSQYEENTITLESITDELGGVINQKLNN